MLADVLQSCCRFGGVLIADEFQLFIPQIHFQTFLFFVVTE